jgi:hypothetical protein
MLLLYSRVRNQTQIHQIIDNSCIGTGKVFFLLMKMNQLTIKVETGHRSLNLILGSSSLSSNCFALILLWLEERLKGWDNGLQKWAEFLRYNFPPPNGTPTPSFIG